VATLRRLTPGDIPQLHRLEAETYLPSLHESDEAFLKIIELFPEGAFGFFEGDELCAYAFAVPLPAGMVLELKTPLTELPPHADSLYIHDVAVGERHRGRGLATRLVATLLARARARAARLRAGLRAGLRAVLATLRIPENRGARVRPGGASYEDEVRVQPTTGVVIAAPVVV
jgi:ribosomal protein S18 acetylase RimI-like enzyme